MSEIPDKPTTPTVRVIHEYGFIVDDGNGGSVWEEDCVECEDHACDDWTEAVEWIRNSGATENAGSWYADPDGSFTARYRDDYRCATTAHVYGFSADDENAIADMISAPCTRS